MSGHPAAPFGISPYGPFGTTTTITAQSSSKPSSSLKPSTSSRLKPKGILPASTLSPPPRLNFARSKTEPIVPASPAVSRTGASDSSSIPRRAPSILKKSGSSIPKPMATSAVITMGSSKHKTSPPSKQYAAFSIRSTSTANIPPPIPSSGSTDKSEKKQRNVIRRKNSSSNSHSTFGLGSFRTGSTTSANGSTTSITSTSSRSGTSALVLGIPLPSNTSSTSLNHYSKSIPSSSKVITQDLPPPISISGYSSSPSTYFNGSPGDFSHTSSPSSASSPSPGFPPPGFRKTTQSPTRPPVTRNRSGSIGQILNDLADKKMTKTDIGLDSVRESTTSTSSSSTVRAGQESITQKNSASSPPPPPPPRLPPSMSPHNALPPRSTTPQVPAKTPSPIPTFGTFRSKSSNSIPTRPSREGTTDLHAAGLGLTIPVIQSNLTTGPGLVKTRSKSTGTVGLGIKTTAQRKGSVPTATPPPPSPSYPPSATGSRRPSITNVTNGASSAPTAGVIASPTIGFAYSSLPAANSTNSRGDSKERGGRERSPTRASPGKIPRPGLFSRGRSKTSDQAEARRGPAAGTGWEGHAHHGKISRGRSGSNTSTSGSWGRSGSQSSITSDSNFGSGRRSGSRESRRGEMDDYFVDKLKPVVLAGGGSVVENQNISSPEYRPRHGSTSEGAGVPMSRSGSEGTSNEGKRPGSRDGPQGFQNILGAKVFGIKRAATPIPAPINTKQPFAHARTPPLGSIGIPRPREVKQSVISAHNNLEKAFTPVIGQEAWTSDLYSQISPPLATDPLPTTAPTKSKRWNFLQRPQASAQKVSPASPPRPSVSTNGRRQVGPAHYALLENLDQQQEAVQIKEIMLELRKKAKEPEANSNGGYINSMRKQQHVHSVLLPDPPLPPQITPSPRPISPPVNSPSPGVNMTPPLAPLPPIQSPSVFRKNTPENDAVEVKKQDGHQTKANERKRLQQAGGRLPLLGSFGKRSEKQADLIISPPQLSQRGHRTRPSESQISQPVPNRTDSKPGPIKLPPLQTQFSKRLQLAGPEGWSAPARVGLAKDIENALTQQLENHQQPQPEAVKAEEPEFQIDWNSYALTSATKGMTIVTSPSEEICDPLDTSVAVTADQDGKHTTSSDDIEDFWSEYDDILEDKEYFGRPFSLELELEATTLLANRSGLKSNTSSLGAPFQFDNLPLTYKALTEAEDVVDRNSYSRESPTLPDPDELGESSTASQKTDSTVFELDDESPTVQVATIATTTAVPPRINIVPFYREKEAGIQVPNTPFSLTKFLKYYSGVGVDGDDSGVLNAIDAVYHGTDSKKGRCSNGSTSSGASTGSSYSIELGLEDEMKLRLWSLMTSTWLNFDRVLVSPAHEELQDDPKRSKGKAKAGEAMVPSDKRILVVDGLGTDEWSYYCALTYPSCTVYNLSSSPNPSNTGTHEEDDSSAGLSKPPNHKQIYHASFDIVFPFPVGFFNVVSLRFLPSSTYPSLPFILQQCQRVLVPGGFIEISVLDADLVNMGNRTKRAVELNRGIMMREFEQTIATAHPGTVSSLTPSTLAARPMSERVTRLLEKGFEDVNRCIVRLPVVGHIDGSLSMGSLHSSVDRTNEVLDNNTDRKSEMFKQPTDSSITDVVSKVGRYWYTRTYERVITGEKGEAMGRSMWMDKGLLRECSKKKTGARLLVAYAKKASIAHNVMPAEVKPTLSLEVPSKPSDDNDTKDGHSPITIPITPGLIPNPLVVNKKGPVSGLEKRVAFKQ